MRSRLQNASLVALLCLTGCGTTPPLKPGDEPPTVVDRKRAEAPTGPSYDEPLVTAVPSAGFVYAAFDGEPTLALLQRILPASTGPAGAALPGLGHWLRQLRSGAAETPLFPRGAALILAAAETEAPERHPLDFCLVAPASPGLAAAIKALAPNDEGLVSGGPRHPPMFVTGGEQIRLSSRPTWPATEGKPWFLAPRAAVKKRAGAFAVFSSQRYRGGPLGARIEARAPDEHAFWQRWGGLMPVVTLEAQAFDGGLALDLWGDLNAEHPREAKIAAVFSEQTQLASPTQVPTISVLYAAAALNWKAVTALRTLDGPARPSGDVANPSPFQASHGEQVSSDPGAVWRAGFSRIGEALSAGLEDWGGPEVALAATWDSQTPQLGALIQNRRPKRAVAQIQRYHSSDVGKRLRFVDATAPGGTAYRYTRLEGVDPRWLEPAYAFVGRSLGLASARGILESFLDDAAPKLEESTSLGGVFSRLGRDLRVAAYLRPSALPRWLDLMGRATAGTPGGAPASAATPLIGATAQAALLSFAERVQGLALGMGKLGARLQVTAVVALHGADTGEEE